MFRAYLIAGVLGSLLFAVAQFRGYSVFGSNASSSTHYSGGSASRIYHK